MAAQLFNRIGQLGLGVAVVGGVVNSALYNGIKFYVFKIININHNNLNVCGWLENARGKAGPSQLAVYSLPTSKDAAIALVVFV